MTFVKSYLFERRYLIAVTVFAVVAALPVLLEPGLLNTRGGGDSPFLLQRLHQLETAVLDGHFPVRWMPDANYGYGYPFYNYYAPLSIYIAAFFRLLGFSFVRAIHLAQLAGFVVAAWGMFGLGKRWFNSEWAGVATAVFYTVAPFHLVNVYVRGDSLAEFWAMAFYPLVILTADNLLIASQTRTNRRRAVASFALTYAALILSHNISAMIFSPFLLLYIALKTLFQYRANQSLNHSITQSLFRPITLSLLALTLALTLAAWFFIPALADQGLAQLDTVTEGYFNYNTHFLATEELPLLQNSFFFDFNVRGRRAFRMGLVQAVTAVITLLLLVMPSRPKNSVDSQRFAQQSTINSVAARRFAKRSPIPDPRSPIPDPRSPIPNPQSPVPQIFILATVLIATFMMLRASVWLWDNLPLLSFTQFPWRFLSVQAFGLALAAGALTKLPKPHIVVPAACALVFVSSFGQLRTDHLILTDADVTAEKLAQYEWFTGNIGTTVSAEYLPINVQPRPYSSDWLNSGKRYTLSVLDGEVTAYELIEARATKQVWRVETAVSTTVILPILDWPGWQATIDGVQLANTPARGSGLMQLNLPAGDHTITAQLTRTPTQRTAELISLFALLLTIPLLFTAHSITQSLNHSINALIALALFATANHLIPQRTLPNDNLTWDFANMGYLHHDVNGTIYQDAPRLLEYHYHPEEAKAGEQVIVELIWEEPVAETAVSLVTPAINRPEFDPTAPKLIEAAGEVDGNSTIHTFTIPTNAPAGLYVPRIAVEGTRALAQSGATRSTIHLRPIRISNEQTAVAERPDVRVSELTAVSDTLARLGLVWQLDEPTSVDYNVSLRLTDAKGNFLVLVDRQPGYGYLPSSGWQPHTLVHDLHLLPIPAAADGHEQPYVLLAQLYDVPTGEPALTRRLGEATWENGRLLFAPTQPQMTIPQELVDEMVGETAVFDDTIQLLGTVTDQTETELKVTLVWQALTDGERDVTRFVHLLDPNGAPQPVQQVDGFPQQNNYPTSQWVAGEIVVDTVSFYIEQTPAGAYQIAVGFYEPMNGTFPRLTAVDAQNNPLPDNRILIDFTLNK